MDKKKRTLFFASIFFVSVLCRCNASVPLFEFDDLISIDAQQRIVSRITQEKKKYSLTFITQLKKEFPCIQTIDVQKLPTGQLMFAFTAPVIKGLCTSYAISQTGFVPLDQLNPKVFRELPFIETQFHDLPNHSDLLTSFQEMPTWIFDLHHITYCTPQAIFVAKDPTTMIRTSIQTLSKLEHASRIYEIISTHRKRKNEIWTADIRFKNQVVLHVQSERINS